MLQLNRAGDPSKTDIPMAPMIDIVFQLLIFFMLNLKIVSPEGAFNVNLPPNRGPGVAELQELRVRMLADADGNLSQLFLGDNPLGNDDRAFVRLNGEILKVVGRPGNPLSDQIDVIIDVDYELRYEYVIKAVSNCTGRLDSKGNVVRYVEKIKFAPPKKKPA
jgi:biopolymer transport protein ExbD